MRFKRKKNVKFRGQKTQGYGSMKKHRGAGSRGGRGGAGTGKRADTRKPSIWKDVTFFGRRGFFSKRKKSEITITIADLNRHIAQWVSAGNAVQQGKQIVVDLKKLEYTKLLSNGTPTKAYVLIISKASAQAKEKITAAGGKVTLDEVGEEQA